MAVRVPVRCGAVRCAGRSRCALSPERSRCRGYRPWPGVMPSIFNGARSASASSRSRRGIVAAHLRLSRVCRPGRLPALRGAEARRAHRRAARARRLPGVSRSDTVSLRNCIEFMICAVCASELGILPGRGRLVARRGRLAGAGAGVRLRNPAMPARVLLAASPSCALPAERSVPYAGAVPDGGRQGQGGGDRRAPIV